MSPIYLLAQELEPRTYAQTPIGVNFIAVGYGFSTGNVLMDPALPIEGLDADLDLVFLRCTRSLALLGRSAKVKLRVPWSAGDWVGSLEGEEQIQRRRDSGAGDLRLALEVNFLGAPAVDREEFREYYSTWAPTAGAFGRRSAFRDLFGDGLSKEAPASGSSPPTTTSSAAIFSLKDRRMCSRGTSFTLSVPASGPPSESDGATADRLLSTTSPDKHCRAIGGSAGRSRIRSLRRRVSSSAWDLR